MSKKKEYTLSFTADELVGQPLEAVHKKIRQLQRDAERDNVASRMKHCFVYVYKLASTAASSSDVELEINALAMNAANFGKRVDRVFLPPDKFRLMEHMYGVPILHGVKHFNLATPAGSIIVYEHSVSTIEAHCA